MTILSFLILLFTPSNYNIYLNGVGKIVVWNTISDKIMIIDESSPLYECYLHNSNSSIPKGYVFDGDLGSEESVHMLCGLLNLSDKEDSMKININRDRDVKKAEETLEIVVTTTLGCNFGCSYCCQGTKKDFAVFNDTFVDDIINIFVSSKLLKLHISWYGGEPLLHSKKIKEASEKLQNYCEKNNLKYTADLLTNGYLLTNKVYKSLTKSGISFFQISLDGSKKNHDNSRFLRNGSPTFDTIMNNVEMVENDKSIQAKIAIRININSLEIDAESIIRDLLSYKVTNWANTKFYLSPIEIRMGTDALSNSNEQTQSGFAELYLDFIRLAKAAGIPLFIPGFYKGICTATKKNSMVLDPNGNIFKCWDEIINEELKLTTIKSNPQDILDKVENNDWSHFKATNTSFCSTCKLLPVCGGNCAIKHSNTTDFDGYHSACPSVKLILKEYLLDKAFSRELLNKEEESTFKLASIPLESLQIK